MKLWTTRSWKSLKDGPVSSPAWPGLSSWLSKMMP